MNKLTVWYNEIVSSKKALLAMINRGLLKYLTPHND